MCDHSLHHMKSRPAAVGDKLITHDFGTGTRGFKDVNQPAGEAPVAVCVLPGTEIGFDEPIRHFDRCDTDPKYSVAIFRQVHKDRVDVHHDTLEFPDGKQVLLNMLCTLQHATVLQLPAAPKTEAEVEEQRRAEFV